MRPGTVLFTGFIVLFSGFYSRRWWAGVLVWKLAGQLLLALALGGSVHCCAAAATGRVASALGRAAAAACGAGSGVPSGNWATYRSYRGCGKWRSLWISMHNGEQASRGWPCFLFDSSQRPANTFISLNLVAVAIPSASSDPLAMQPSSSCMITGKCLACTRSP